MILIQLQEGWSAMMQSFELLRRSLSGDHVAAEFSKLAEVPTEQGLAEVMEQGVVVGEAASGEPEECGGYRAMA